MKTVYSGLVLNDENSLDEEIINVCARVIQQYAQEDGLTDDENDVRLERLLRTGERFLKRYIDVVNMSTASGGPENVRSWQTARMPEFNKHASDYHKLYSQISHMAEAPYFLTVWTLCYAVDSALIEHGVTDLSAYNALTLKEVDAINYTIRFLENLLQELHSEFMS